MITPTNRLSTKNEPNNTKTTKYRWAMWFLSLCGCLSTWKLKESLKNVQSGTPIKWTPSALHKCKSTGGLVMVCQIVNV
jgi:hypothetical protein